MNLNDTPSGGPLRAVDLDCNTNTGRIYWLQGQQDSAACTGACDTGPCVCCLSPAEACTELGTDTRPGALSMADHRRTASRVAMALLAVPTAAAVVAVTAFAVRHWPG